LTPQDQKQERPQVINVVQGVHEAWDQGDPDLFVSDYLEDASVTLPGSFMKSREEIHAALAHSFNGPLRGTRASGKVLDVRFLNDETAVVITETGVLIPGESAARPERTAYVTWVLAKRNGKWRLAVYSSSCRH
jgi:uncharacterized protein (TIGR02246 family)